MCNKVLFSLKKEEILPLMTTWMNLQDIMWNKPVAEWQMPHGSLTSIQNSQRKLEWWFAGDLGEEEMGNCFSMDINVSGM